MVARPVAFVEMTVAAKVQQVELVNQAVAFQQIDGAIDGDARDVGIDFLRALETVSITCRSTRRWRVSRIPREPSSRCKRPGASWTLMRSPVETRCAGVAAIFANGRLYQMPIRRRAKPLKRAALLRLVLGRAIFCEGDESAQTTFSSAACRRTPVPLSCDLLAGEVEVRAMFHSPGAATGGFSWRAPLPVMAAMIWRPWKRPFSMKISPVCIPPTTTPAT
jgi:hypothetical protein